MPLSKSALKKRGQHFVALRSDLHLRYTGKELKLPHFTEDDFIFHDKPTEQPPKVYAKSASPLLRLPRELRDRIYGLAVVEPDKTTLLDTAIPPPLARTCGQIRDECLAMWVRDTQFHVFFARSPSNGVHGMIFAPATAGWIKEIGVKAHVYRHVSFSFENSLPHELYEEYTTPPLTMNPFHLQSIVAMLVQKSAFRIDYMANGQGAKISHCPSLCTICAQEIPDGFEVDTSDIQGREVEYRGGLDVLVGRHDDYFRRFKEAFDTTNQQRGGVSTSELGSLASFMTKDFVASLMKSLYEVGKWHLTQAMEAHRLEAETNGFDKAYTPDGMPILSEATFLSLEKRGIRTMPIPE